MSFGQYLKEHMKEQKITQAELAEKIGVARSTVSMYTSDVSLPPVDVLSKIEFILGLDHFEVLAVTAEQKENIRNTIKAQVKDVYGKEAVELLEALPHLTKAGKEKLLERVSELMEIKKYNTNWMLDILSE